MTKIKNLALISGICFFGLSCSELGLFKNKEKEEITITSFKLTELVDDYFVKFRLTYDAMHHDSTYGLYMTHDTIPFQNEPRDSWSEWSFTTESGVFEGTITHLDGGRKYYVKPFFWKNNRRFWGQQDTITLPAPTPPDVRLSDFDLITSNSCFIAPIIDRLGGLPILRFGLFWGEDSDISLERNLGKIEFIPQMQVAHFIIEGLIANTTYIVKPYAENRAGLVIGEEKRFTTLAE